MQALKEVACTEGYYIFAGPRDYWKKKNKTQKTTTKKHVPGTFCDLWYHYGFRK